MEKVKILTKALLVMVLLLLFTRQAFAPPPIKIYDANDLLAVNDDLDGSYRLEADIDLSGYGCDYFTTAVIAPDGSNAGTYYDGTPFTGTFDGQEYCISGLCIDTQGADNDFLGLFGKIDPSAEVKDLCLENVSITGGNLSAYVGALAGEAANDSVITSCSSSGALTIGGSYTSHTAAIGGLIGNNGADIYDSYSECTVTTGREPWYVGGLVGLNGGDISCSYATGDVNTGTDGYAGHYVGGLIGYNSTGGPLPLSRCYATGNVTGYGYVGGLIGSHYFGDIENCYAKGNVTASYGSGLVHEVFVDPQADPNHYIAYCYSTGSVSGTYPNSSGCIGTNIGCDINECYWDVNTSGMTESRYGEAKTTAEMQTESTYTSAGWDFTDTWMIIEEGATYPELKCQPENECTALHVDSIDMQLKNAPQKKKKAEATITILDCLNNPVSQVGVWGQWSGQASDSDSGMTDINGQVVFTSDPGSQGTFTITVTDVSKLGYTYDPNDNNETSDSITY